MKSAKARRQRVERLEREAEQAPARYQLKLALLALLGYAVLGGALLLTLGLLVFLVGYMLIARPVISPFMAVALMMLALSGAVVMRALWIRFVPPDGHPLQPGEAPELQAEVERIRKAVGAAQLHGIVVNAELNAAAAYVPRGFGGWGQRHYLILGLPLLHALDRRELAAVVAHEFGHFDGGHGHFTAWIYRLRSSWHRLLEGMAGGMAGGQLLWFFFRWYAPYFDAYSQVLARRQEYAADAVSAQIAGAEAAVSALVRIELASDWLENDFWPQVNESVRAQAYPPVAVHEQLAERLSIGIARDARIPARLLARATAPEDTHPTLMQRAVAMQCEPRQLDGPADAAATLLGDLDAKLQQRFSLEWRTAAEVEWKARHQAVQRERQRLAELEAHPTHTPAEAVELACLSEDHHPGVEVLPLYREALRRAPSNANGHYRLGALLLKRESAAEAMQHLQRAMELDATLVEPALRALDRHAGVEKESPAWQASIDTLRDRYSRHPGEIDEEDAHVLESHALDASQLRELSRALRGYDKVRKAWVVRRPLLGTEVMPHFLVMLDWAGSVASEQAALPRIASQLQ
ncbi:MAG: M48 family metallopeptidase, partial [Pseudoxanthomonas sp.]